jgi:phosphonatase-like hydrolase
MPSPASLLRLVVFDMAGTTVRDDGQVPRAFVAALAAHGIEVNDEAIVAVRGASKREAVRHFVPDGPDHDRTADAIYATFCAHLRHLFKEMGVHPVAGAADAFAVLRGHGIKVAITTGFDREIMSMLLAALGWERGVANVLVCLDDVANGRPAPDLILKAMALAKVTDPKQVAAVGDTTLDLQAGDRAGVSWNVGVLSGGHDRARLEQAPHTHIFSTVADFAHAVLAELHTRPVA